MATNKPAGDGHRNGAVRKRSQLENPITGTMTKRDTTSGEFMDVKADEEKLKACERKRNRENHDLTSRMFEVPGPRVGDFFTP